MIGISAMRKPFLTHSANIWASISKPLAASSKRRTAPLQFAPKAHARVADVHTKQRPREEREEHNIDRSTAQRSVSVVTTHTCCLCSRRLKLTWIRFSVTTRERI